MVQIKCRDVIADEHRHFERRNGSAAVWTLRRAVSSPARFTRTTRSDIFLSNFIILQRGWTQPRHVTGQALACFLPIFF
jgi:hypothetical protein